MPEPIKKYLGDNVWIEKKPVSLYIKEERLVMFLGPPDGSVCWGNEIVLKPETQVELLKFFAEMLKD